MDKLSQMLHHAQINNMSIMHHETFIIKIQHFLHSPSILTFFNRSSY